MRYGKDVMQILEKEFGDDFTDYSKACTQILLERYLTEEGISDEDYHEIQRLIGMT